MKICLAYNEFSGKKQNWINAFENKAIEYIVVDISRNDWLEKITSEEVDLVMGLPNGNISYQKQLFDERMYVIKHVLGYPIYPFYNELLVYENKRMLSYFLKAKSIPHPKTDVFYDIDEANDFTNRIKYPIVAKSNIGAAGSGVKIIKTEREAKKYIKIAFKKGGIRRRLGPNRVTGSKKKWFIKAVQDPSYFRMKIKTYLTSYNDAQKSYVIFQEFIPHNFEWRVIRIGESYFAHKKLAYKGKASGVKQLEFTDPPKKLLTLCKNICESNNFQSVSIDLFENKNNGYLVNELQTFWGHKADPITGSFYRLAVNGVPGRYLFKNNKWVFEEGDFNTNHSCDLRLEHALDLFSKNLL